MMNDRSLKKYLESKKRFSMVNSVENPQSNAILARSGVSFATKQRSKNLNNVSKNESSRTFTPSKSRIRVNKVTESRIFKRVEQYCKLNMSLVKYK